MIDGRTVAIIIRFIEDRKASFEDHALYYDEDPDHTIEEFRNGDDFAAWVVHDFLEKSAVTFESVCKENGVNAKEIIGKVKEASV